MDLLACARDGAAGQAYHLGGWWNVRTAAAGSIAAGCLEGSLSKVMAHIWQVLWGFPQTVLGLMLRITLRGPRRHYQYRTAYVTEWNLSAGFTSGMFIFVPRNCPRRLLAHEYGHTLQSLLLGPLYLPVVVFPSLVWAGTPRLQRYRSARGYSYYRFPVERWANLLAERVTGEQPEGWYERRERRRIKVERASDPKPEREIESKSD